MKCKAKCFVKDIVKLLHKEVELLIHDSYMLMIAGESSFLSYASH
jgi:hypothetical protein